jgi:hypothetical protein
MRNAILLCLLGVSSVLAQAGTNCHPVGGTISTNFLDPTTTLGSATGDLAGGLGVTVLSLVQNPNGTATFHNHHHWVTVTGDTINLLDAYATAYPTGVPGLFAANYDKGVTIAGGTGKFLHAVGKVSSWGAVNLITNEIVLRYEGTVCFAGRDVDQ